MTAQSDHGHTGLDRDNNLRPDVNQEAKEEGNDPAATDAMKERQDELKGNA
ncbi:hypothetical protein KEM60_03166 [Austwickia sp. TVS 96-490-7B]|uniref:hypothetical protein n=1 Tax=Austwickia sp. TVS 96-490-7B TaxID=2830843 RepID=UPI001C574451|nr:hypothetical protein [Austwickia sp. TVS 96-490-7B]MBW3086937.1 hypothetical protein [Austwickia sp. TVS 96-490-7B]